jgi:hypothetical protein
MWALGAQHMVHPVGEQVHQARQEGCAPSIRSAAPDTPAHHGISVNSGHSIESFFRLQPGAPHSSFGMYSEMTQHASLLKPACFTSRSGERAAHDCLHVSMQVGYSPLYTRTSRYLSLSPARLR